MHFNESSPPIQPGLAQKLRELKRKVAGPLAGVGLSSPAAPAWSSPIVGQLSEARGTATPPVRGNGEQEPEEEVSKGREKTSGCASLQRVSGSLPEDSARLFPPTRELPGRLRAEPLASFVTRVIAAATFRGMHKLYEQSHATKHRGQPWTMYITMTPWSALDHT